MEEQVPRFLSFGEYSLDPLRNLLIRSGGETVPLSPKAYETLEFLVRSRGRVVGKDELMSAVWNDTAVEENNLNQCITAIRRALGEKRGENRYIATMQGIGYKFVGEVSEHQPAGQATVIPNSSRGKSSSPIRSAGLLLIAFLITAGSIAGYFFWSRTGAYSSDMVSGDLAVLPFKPLSPESRNEVLELGMTDTLISKLGSGPNLRVRPLGSVRRFASLDADPLKAGRELGADSVLEGSVQTSAERIRVSVRLLRVEDGRQLWAATFDEDLRDIFSVQDSISERVAGALRIELDPRRKRNYTDDPEAYQLYIKGRYHAVKLVREDSEKAISFFNAAIERDPGYALAYVGLADVYRASALTYDSPSFESMVKCKAAAERAVALDENLADAHSALAAAAFWYDWNWKAAEDGFKRAIDLDKRSPIARTYYAHLLSNLGRHHEALSEIRKALELEPANVLINAISGQILHFAGQPDEAMVRLRETVELEPNFWLSHLMLSRVYELAGDHGAAVAEARKAERLSGDNTEAAALAGYSLAKSGNQAAARRELEKLRVLAKSRYVPMYNLALLHVALGNHTESLNMLEKAYELRDTRMVFLKIDPKWDPLRSEPRFIRLLEKMNL